MPVITSLTFIVLLLCALRRPPHAVLLGPRGKVVIVISPGDTTTSFLERRKPGSRIALRFIWSSPFEYMYILCLVFIYSHHDSSTSTGLFQFCTECASV